jgi:DNA-binding NarL/FixJ family response regulator
MTSVRVTVQASDAIAHEGLMSMLGSRPELSVVEREQLTARDVLVVQVDSMTSEAIAELRASAEHPVPIVLIARALHENDVMVVVECRVAAVLYSTGLSSDQLAKMIVSVAAGCAELPPVLLGGLMGAVCRLQQDVLSPRGLDFAGFTSREVAVLRLMAEGQDTGEIAHRLCYSERTVKTIIWFMTTRLKLRNRPHAVARAVRAGVI